MTKTKFYISKYGSRMRVQNGKVDVSAVWTDADEKPTDMNGAEFVQFTECGIPIATGTHPTFSEWNVGEDWKPGPNWKLQAEW